MISFDDLNKAILDRWSTVDAETKEYCEMTFDAEIWSSIKYMLILMRTLMTRMHWKLRKVIQQAFEEREHRYRQRDEKHRGQ